MSFQVRAVCRRAVRHCLRARVLVALLALVSPPVGVHLRVAGGDLVEPNAPGRVLALVPC